MYVWIWDYLESNRKRERNREWNVQIRQKKLLLNFRFLFSFICILMILIASIKFYFYDTLIIIFSLIEKCYRWRRRVLFTFVCFTSKARMSREYTFFLFYTFISKCWRQLLLELTWINWPLDWSIETCMTTFIYG